MSEMDATLETHLALLPPSERMLDESVDIHRNFNRQKWGSRESFHNDEHIRAVSSASDKLIDAAKFGEDPLDLNADLKTWNNLHPDAQVHSLDELKKVFRITISTHDWGNIVKDMTVESGMLKPIYLEGYRAKGAEDRSIQFVELAINNEAELTVEEKSRFIPLAQYLIGQTRFMFDPDDSQGEKPFARSIRIIDQIGNDIFTENKRVVMGLLEEQVDENPEAEFVPDFFFNFVRNRFGQLATENEQQMLLKIWGKEMPAEVRGVPIEKMKVADFLRQERAKVDPDFKYAQQLTSANTDQGITAAMEREFKEKTGKSLTRVLGQPRGVEELAINKS